MKILARRLVAVLATLMASTSVRADVVYRTVAVSGTQAPGAPAGAVFASFDAPRLNADGQAVFVAKLQTGGSVSSNNDSGLWSEGSGSLALVAREGSHAPATPVGANFDDFGALTAVLNASGQLAFRAGLRSGSGGVTSSNNDALWSQISGSLALVARKGSQAPDTPTGAMFTNFSSIVMNGSGQTAFVAGLQTGSGGVNSNNSTGIWSDRSGAVALVARGDDPAPGAPAGARFSGFGNDPVINAAGQIAFRGSLQTGVGGVTTADNTGIWSEGSGTLDLVARAGQQPPGAPVGAQFASFNVAQTKPVINDAGQIAFRAFMQNGSGGVTFSNDWGVWSEGSGTLSLVAREGDHAPGAPAGADFAEFGDPVINAAGQTAFAARLSGAGSIDRGIWSERSGTLSLVAIKGAQAPGTPLGVNFSFFQDPAINSSGSVAFFANLAGSGVGGSNSAGIWAQDAAGQLWLVARSGDPFEVSPGVIRTIQGFNFFGASGGQDGRALIFNDDFTVVFKAYFTDGSQGVFTALVTAVPEVPAWAFAAAVSSVAVATGWRRAQRRQKTHGARPC